MSRRLVAVGIAVLAVAAAVSIWRSRLVAGWRAGSCVEKAEAHRKAHAYDEARKDLRSALALVPGDGGARQKLAAVEMEAGNWEVAFIEYETLTQVHPEDPSGWISLARMMARGGLLAAPEAALDKAMALGPAGTDVRALRAEIRFRLGRRYGARLDAQASGGKVEGQAPVPPARVLAEAEGLAVLSHEHWPGRLARMRQALEQRLRQQDWEGAQRVVDSARALSGDTVFPPFLAGILEMARGKADEAERQFREALLSAPRSPVVVTALAKAWSREKGAAFAAERLMELGEKDPGFSFARSLAARAWMDARDPAKAEAALRRGLALQPGSAEPFVQLAEHFQGLDRASDALAAVQQGLERFPHALELAMLSARLDVSGAARVYEDVLSRRPDLDLVEYKLAALAEGERARQILQHLGEDEPSDPALMDTLGWLHSRVGSPARARQLLEAAVKAAPGEPMAHFHLAMVYAGAKERELSRTELKAAVESDRPFARRLEALRLLRGDDPQERQGLRP